MGRIFQKLVLAVCAAASVTTAYGFSMAGPFEAWMTADIGLNTGVTFEDANGDISGPMNLGEEYRWNTPIITYAYDRTFQDYFGTKGIEAVESAVALVNALPPVSSLSEDLSEIPLNVARINNLATELRLKDIKTTVVSILLEYMGLTAPERYVWQIRSRKPTPVPGLFLFSIVQRNFDPVTFEPSRYVNGTRYSYQIFTSADFSVSEAIEYEIDPSLPNSSVVGITANQAGNAVGFTRVLRIQESLGLYINGLTRDDVGGLRYLYHPSNVNVESAPGDAVGDQAGGFAIGGSSTQDDSPWGLPGGVTGGLTNAAAGGGGSTNSNFIFVGPRPGIDRIEFRRVPYDNLRSNQVFVARYPETIITNFAGSIKKIRQTVTRTITRPDILFTAADLGVFANFPAPFAYRRAENFSNNGALHSAGSDLQGGPGNLGTSFSTGNGITAFPPLQITLNKVGLANIHTGDGPEEQRDIGFTIDGGFTWAIFDGTTNAPVIFPNGTSIKDMERRIFGR